MTQHGGGTSLYFGVDTSSLNNQSQRSSTFTNEWAMTYAMQ